VTAPSVFPFHPGGSDTVRYYSLARYALRDALTLLGVGPGQRVLLPALICRDLLAPIAMLGAKPCWYEVDAGLLPVGSPNDWPKAEAVLAVNYFGFAQDLAPFVAYSQRTGARIIEDNAHGYLSRDPKGCWLGARAPLGLFSFRKTIRVPDGAALLVGDASLVPCLPEQLPFDGGGIHSAQTLKARMRQIPLVGSRFLRAATVVARTIRKQKTGSAIPLSNPFSESEIPAAPNPWTGLLDAVARFDGNSEIARRRKAYIQCAMEGERVGVMPVFPTLPDYCAPYGYPFRSNIVGRDVMQRMADRMGFDLVTWPDLPGAVRETAPLYYQDVQLINFLW
jgi:hypothetical protein